MEHLSLYYPAVKWLPVVMRAVSRKTWALAQCNTIQHTRTGTGTVWCIMYMKDVSFSFLYFSLWTIVSSHMKRWRDSMNTTVHANCYNVDIALVTFGTWLHSNDSIIPMPINHGITSNYLAGHRFYTSNWFTAKPVKAVVWCGNVCTVQHQMKNVSREKYQIKLVYSSPSPTCLSVWRCH